MHDIAPPASAQWAAIEAVLRAVFGSYDFREIRLPLVESTTLFQRSIGEVTDIVEKEMYSFPDRNGDSLTLRPEGTAGCVRAVLEQGMLNTVQKLWYLGPMFRYERPQKGRQRQFHQVGAEVFGIAGVEAEVEILLLNQRMWKLLGVADTVQLQLNNIGSSADRAAYRAALVDYLNTRREQLDPDSQRRLESNPLRILDSKSPDTQALLDDAPRLVEFLSAESSQRHQQLLELLAAADIKVQHNERLVRGLDYYNDTVFEWVSDDLGAQATVCGGGRYDGLVEQLGGKPCTAVGFGLGLERLFLLLEARQFEALDCDSSPDIYTIVGTAQLQRESFALLERLRDVAPDFAIMHPLASGSLKSQFKKADRSGAAIALVIAADEVSRQEVTVKNLRTGEQASYSIAGELDTLLAALRGALAAE